MVARVIKKGKKKLRLLDVCACILQRIKRHAFHTKEKLGFEEDIRKQIKIEIYPIFKIHRMCGLEVARFGAS